MIEDELCNFNNHKKIGQKKMSMKRMASVMDRRPRLLLVYADSVFAANCSRHFRRLGWEVRMAAAGEDPCELVQELAPTAVVLDADLPDEQAWQTCGQITRQHPGLTVVLSAADRFEDDAGQRHIDGAALVTRSEGVEALADRILSTSMASAM